MYSHQVQILERIEIKDVPFCEKVFISIYSNLPNRLQYLQEYLVKTAIAPVDKRGKLGKAE